MSNLPMDKIGRDVELAARLLRAGKLVAFATETVYGLGANAWDVAAIARVFAVKDRPHFDPLIVHVADVGWVSALAEQWPDTASRLAEQFWPGPMTLVVPKRRAVPDLVTAGLPAVGIRIPGHPLALEMLRRADMPVAAPSANRFGRLSPTCAEHVLDGLGSLVDYVLDGGACAVGVESTVLKIEGAHVSLLRPGGVTVEAIEDLIGPIVVPPPATVGVRQPAAAPGMMAQHYAPCTPLVLVNSLAEVPHGPATGVLLPSADPDAAAFDTVEVLTTNHDLTEAAANFFAALRRLDRSGVTTIYAIRLPPQGLGRAINDRLERAAATPHP